jgi:hypothetical protein
MNKYNKILKHYNISHNHTSIKDCFDKNRFLFINVFKKFKTDEYIARFIGY